MSKLSELHALSTPCGAKDTGGSAWVNDSRFLGCGRGGGIPVMAYEPTLGAPEFFGSEVTHDLVAFKSRCDAIVANRWSDDQSDVAAKVHTRDLVKRD